MMSRKSEVTVHRRQSALKWVVWQFFGAFESPCRLLIEVFTRRGFGERYFRLSNAVSTCLFFALWPFIWRGIKFYVQQFVMVAFHGLIDIRLSSEGSFYLDYAGWYIYLALFLVMSIRHHLEMKQAASTLDFAQYSFDNGKAHKVFLDIDVGGKKGNDRIIECWLEPGAAFLVGFMLALIGQALGWLLMFSAVVYAISYRSAYEAADNSVLDLIDDMIINRGLAESFLNDAAKSETLGYRFLGRKPSDLEKRKVVFEQMMKNRDKDVTIPK